MDWFEQRLSLLERVAQKPVASLFDRRYHHHPQLAAKYNLGKPRYELHHFDLFSTKATSWEKEEKGVYWGTIALHPSYEAKMLVYLLQHPGLFETHLRSGKACFWIVGSTPSWAAMEKNLDRGDSL